MAYLLETAIVDGGDGEIKVVHQFFGLTKKEVENYKREHLNNCDYYATAEREGRTLESLEKIADDDLPTSEDYAEEEEEQGQS